jgi:hypothetical protein
MWYCNQFSHLLTLNPCKSCIHWPQQLLWVETSKVCQPHYQGSPLWNAQWICKAIKAPHQGQYHRKQPFLSIPDCLSSPPSTCLGDSLKLSGHPPLLPCPPPPPLHPGSMGPYHHQWRALVVMASFSELTLPICLHVAAHLCLVLLARCRRWSIDKVGIGEVIAANVAGAAWKVGAILAWWVHVADTKSTIRDFFFQIFVSACACISHHSSCFPPFSLRMIHAVPSQAVPSRAYPLPRQYFGYFEVGESISFSIASWFPCIFFPAHLHFSAAPAAKSPANANLHPLWSQRQPRHRHPCP